VSALQVLSDITSGQKPMNRDVPTVANFACSDSRNDMNAS
jgi:hypothetical protein